MMHLSAKPTAMKWSGYWINWWSAVAVTATLAGMAVVPLFQSERLGDGLTPYLPPYTDVALLVLGVACGFWSTLKWQRLIAPVGWSVCQDDPIDYTPTGHLQEPPILFEGRATRFVGVATLGATMMGICGWIYTMFGFPPRLGATMSVVAVMTHFLALPQVRRLKEIVECVLAHERAAQAKRA